MVLARLLGVACLVALAGTRGDVLAQEKSLALSSVRLPTSSAHTLTIRQQNSTLATLEVPAGVTLTLNSEKPTIYTTHNTGIVSEVRANGNLYVVLSKHGGPKVYDVGIMTLEEVSVRIVPR